MNPKSNAAIDKIKATVYFANRHAGEALGGSMAQRRSLDFGAEEK